MRLLRRWLAPFRAWRDRRRRASDRPFVRRRGVRALDGEPRETAVPLLVSALDDPHPLVRAAAAEGLAAHRAAEGLGPLLDAVEEEAGNPYLSATFWEAIGRIAGEEIAVEPDEDEETARRRIEEWRRKIS